MLNVFPTKTARLARQVTQERLELENVQKKIEEERFWEKQYVAQMEALNTLYNDYENNENDSGETSSTPAGSANKEKAAHALAEGMRVNPHQTAQLTDARDGAPPAAEDFGTEGTKKEVEGDNPKPVLADTQREPDDGNGPVNTDSSISPQSPPTIAPLFRAAASSSSSSESLVNRTTSTGEMISGLPGVKLNPSKNVMATRHTPGRPHVSPGYVRRTILHDALFGQSTSKQDLTTLKKQRALLKQQLGNMQTSNAELRRQVSAIAQELGLKAPDPESVKQVEVPDVGDYEGHHGLSLKVDERILEDDAVDTGVLQLRGGVLMCIPREASLASL